MDQPLFQRDPATGEISEYRPVAVKREDLEADLTEATKAADAADQLVSDLDTQHEELTNELKAVSEARDNALVDQEAKREAAAFRQAKLVAYDSVPPVDPASVNATPSATPETATTGAVAGQPTPEDVAESLDLEPDTDEPLTPSEEVILPVRRRAAV